MGILGGYTQKAHSNIFLKLLFTEFQVDPGTPWSEKTLRGKPSSLIHGFNFTSIQRYFQQTWVIKLGNAMLGKNRGVTIK